MKPRSGTSSCRDACLWDTMAECADRNVGLRCRTARSIGCRIGCGVSSDELTGLINAWQSGDQAALEAMMPHVYEELHRLARGQMRGETSSHTLQATALVNEAFIRLANVRLSYEDRSHFLAMAARTMRRVLVDHARQKKRAKRGGGVREVTLDEGAAPAAAADPAMLDLDRALTRLARVDEHLAAAAELVYFGGLSYDEAAGVLGTSKTALFEDLKLARAWLKNYMNDGAHREESISER